MSETTELVASLAHLSEAEVALLGRQVAQLAAQESADAPQTNGELWQWIQRETGFEVPRVAVCEGHVAPFTFLADLYFRRTTSTIGIANRGGSKTFLVALLHYLNGRTRKGVEAITVGATEAQGQRCYEHLRKLLGPNASKYVSSSIQSKTTFRSGGKVEVLPGTARAVNGPHPAICHTDEMEQMDPDCFAESRNCSQTAYVDGVEIPAQDIITSTRKRAAGPVQALLDEVAAAKLAGHDPPHDVYTWCVFEVAKQVEGCQCARPDLPAGERCECDTVVKGVWDETGKPRTLKDVCKGRFYRSRGFLPYAHVKKKFMENQRGIWEAQQTCERPSLEGLVFPQWSRDRHGVLGFDVDAANGPIYQGIDFGGTNPHCVLWMQVLRVEVEAVNHAGETVRLREGTRVVFSEVYKAEIGNVELGRRMRARDELYAQQHGGFRVSARFADPQAKSARLDLADAGLPCVWYGATRDIREQVKRLIDHLDDERLVIDLRRCPMLVEEIEAYHYPKKRPGQTDDPELPVDDFNHALSALRYASTNLDMIGRRAARRTQQTPSAAPSPYPERDSTLPAANMSDPHEAWRKRFGGTPGAEEEPWRT